MSGMLFNRMAAAVTELRKLQPSMSIQALQVFLEVAAKDGINASELKTKTQIPQPTVSRILSDLGDWAGRRGTEGLRLLSTVRDTDDMRNVRCFLTPTGKLLANHMASIMGHGTPE